MLASRMTARSSFDMGTALWMFDDGIATLGRFT